MTEDSYIILAKKLQALVNGGVGGEAENAQRFLDKLMTEHNISMSDLDDEVINSYDIFYDIRIPYIDKLITQVAYSVLGNINPNKGVYTYRFFNNGRARWHKLSVKCTANEYVEILAKYEFYTYHYKNELENFYQAFIIANNIYSPESLRVKDDDTEYIQPNKDAIKLSMMMDSHDYLTKIEAPHQE